ncbi:MAG TPA: DUF1919 domain-containing protein [Gammaproteobacteria bacterium]|nr:DUF1919 domain-containing protein [Gammaproteobacteria bacterium]
MLKRFYKAPLTRLTKVFLRGIKKHLIANPHISIVSDDCWGAEYYKEFNLPYLTPTVGLFINAPSYIDFIYDLERNLQSELCFSGSEYDFPFCRVNGCEIGFMHYKSLAEVRQKWQRRCQRIDYGRLFFKIDFGRPGFTKQDIERWNKMALPNSIALVNDTFKESFVHNGVYIPDWELNGVKQYTISRKYFSLVTWVNSGEITPANSFDRLLI